MSRQMVFFLFTFIWGSVFAAMMAGGNALATAQVTTSMTDDVATATVDSTTDFATSGYLYVDNEIIQYSGTTATTFTGLTRGQDKTDATSHPAGTRVYSEVGGIVNQMASFNVVETLADDGFVKGGFRMVVTLPLALVSDITKMIMWDFSFLDGHGAWVKYLLLYPLSLGLVTSLVLMVFRRGAA